MLLGILCVDCDQSMIKDSMVLRSLRRHYLEKSRSSQAFRRAFLTSHVHLPTI